MNNNFRFCIVVVCFLITFVSCKKSATTWSSDWSVPLVNDTLSLANLLNDSTLELDGSGYYNVILSRSLLDVNLNDVVEIPDTTMQKAFTIIFPTLNVPPGFTFVNTAEENEIYPGDAELKKFTVKSGNIEFTVKNPLETKVSFTITLPGTTKEGQEFSQGYEVPAAFGGVDGEATQSFDISGYTFDLTGLNGNKNNLFVSQVGVTSDPNGPTVVMTNSDSIRFDASFKDVYLNYARGFFGTSNLSDTITQSIGVLKMYQSGLFDLPNTTIQLEVVNGIKVGAQATLTTMSNENVLGSTVLLNNSQLGMPFNINPATGSWGTLAPSSKTIEFNSSNSNIESYLENLGFAHTVGYSIQLNPWGNISGGWDELFPSSRLSLRLNANLPLSIGADNLVVQDTFEFNYTPPVSGNRIVSGDLTLTAKNAFPVGASTTLYLINTNGNVEYTLAGTSDLISSVYGQPDPTSGLLVSNSNIVFSLTEEMVNKLRDIEHVVVRAEFNTPDPITGANQQVNIPEGAFLGIRIRSDFKFEAEL